MWIGEGNRVPRALAVSSWTQEEAPPRLRAEEPIWGQRITVVRGLPVFVESAYDLRGHAT